MASNLTASFLPGVADNVLTLSLSSLYCFTFAFIKFFTEFLNEPEKVTATGGIKRELCENHKLSRNCK